MMMSYNIFIDILSDNWWFIDDSFTIKTKEKRNNLTDFKPLNLIMIITQINDTEDLRSGKIHVHMQQ